jgi:hypothetical protein
MENTMTILKHLKTTCFLAAAATILVATGCQSDTHSQADNNASLQPDENGSYAKAESDAEHSEDEISDTERLERTQMAAGARFDCTLYPSHFDGSTLSTLGTRQLDLALADKHSANPIVVYLAVPEDNYAQDRRQAIGRYLEDRGGLKPEQIEFRSGPNPETLHSVDTQLGYYPKTDTATDGGSTYANSAAGGGGK